MDLGRLEKVDLRSTWKSEAGDFTPWLAKEENLRLLGETIGLELELEAQEKNVGPFKADILCKEITDEHWVLIENQLERTDHKHLGQLMTYAAGLDAVTIIWVAENFTDEHRAALDWLNEITGDEISFFGLEVELWKIGDSLVAPKFNMVSKPNDWTKSVSGVKNKFTSDVITSAQELQLEFWTQYRDYMLNNSKNLKPQNITTPRPFMRHSIGRSGFTLVSTISITANKISVEFQIKKRVAEKLFYQLLENKDAIEAKLGYPVIWRELPGRKKSGIMYSKENVNLLDKSKWSEIHIWFKEHLEKFYSVFRPEVMSFDANDSINDEDDDE